MMATLHAEFDRGIVYRINLGVQQPRKSEPRSASTPKRGFLMVSDRELLAATFSLLCELSEKLTGQAVTVQAIGDDGEPVELCGCPGKVRFFTAEPDSQERQQT